MSRLFTVNLNEKEIRLILKNIKHCECDDLYGRLWRMLFKKIKN